MGHWMRSRLQDVIPALSEWKRFSINIVLLLNQLSLTPEWRIVEAVEVVQGLANRTGVIRQTLDVLEGHVDDTDGAGLAVQVAAGEASEAGSVGNAALAVRMEIWPWRQAAGQRATLYTWRLARSQLHGRPGGWRINSYSNYIDYEKASNIYFYYNHDS